MLDRRTFDRADRDTSRWICGEKVVECRIDNKVVGCDRAKRRAKAWDIGPCTCVPLEAGLNLESETYNYKLICRRSISIMIVREHQ